MPVHVAIIFRRFGPYHMARLRAAAAVLAVTGIEFAGRDATYAWDAVADDASFKRVTLQAEALGGCRNRAQARKRLWSVLDQAQPAVVALPGWSMPEALAGLSWCLARRIPAVVMSESTYWDEARVLWKEAIKRRLVSLFSAGLVGGAPHAEYLAELGMAPDRIFLGYDVVDNAHFARPSGTSNQQPLPTPITPPLHHSTTPFFLASARFIPKKNLPRLIQAYARYRQMSEVRSQKSEVRSAPADLRPPPSALWPLVLLGDGPLRSDLCHLISDLGLQDSVHLPGFKQYDELPAYYHQAGAFIHASTTEQWGLVVNEAMADGLPVLVSNRCGCARDLVQEGVNGFTFDPYDTEQLARLMLRFWTLGSRLSTFGSASQRIIANWGPDRFAAGLKQAVETALRVGPSRARFLDRLLLGALHLKQA